MQFTSVQGFLDHVQSELDANRLVLPTLPDIALKVKSAVADSNISAKELADMIMTDAALSTQIIRVANSPRYRGASEINNIQTAVSRLGNNTIRTLVISLVMKQMFRPSSKLLESLFRKIWEQSINVSAISRALCAFAPHLDPEEAMLAGLIHQIGKLPVLVLAENIPEFKYSPTRMEKLLEKAHPAVGKLIMNAWDFPENLKPVVSEYVNFLYDPGPKADYVDVVQVAFLQSIAGTDHPACRVDCSAVPSFAKLGFTTGTEILEIEGISDEIEIARNLLS